MSNTTPVSPTTRASSSTQYTPSSTLSVQDYGDHDPDFPLPSIERDIASASAGSESTPASPIYTPSVSSRASILGQGSDYENLDQHLQNIRLGSATQQASTSGPANAAFQRQASNTSSTPSIRVTSTPSAADSRRSPINRRTDSLVNGISRLEIGTTG